MREITVKASRLPLHKGSRVPGYPGLAVGEYVGGSPYTFDRIYDMVDQDGKSSGLVIKVCWQPLGVPLGMSMRALEHEWVMYNNIQVFSSKHPELSNQLLHAQAAIFTSETPSSICDCCPGAPDSQQKQQHGVTGSNSNSNSSSSSSSSSSSDYVVIHEVTPGDAAASVSSTTTAPKRTIAALIVEKADGLTVKQRIKKKSFNNIRYIAELLLQLPQLLKVLESELGFVHDDLRLDNIMESWQDQTAATTAAGPPSAAKPSGSSSSKNGRVDVLAAPAGHCPKLDNPDSQSRDQDLQQQGDLAQGTARSSNSSHICQSDPRTSGSDTPIFKLFDFGLSIINPDPHSRGVDSRKPPQEKNEALQRLHQQGYVFHKALGVVNLFHVFQFGRAADVYRLCKSLSGHLSKRTWPAADRPLVEVTLQLLATISGKSITAYFAEEYAAQSDYTGNGGNHRQEGTTGAHSRLQQRQHVSLSSDVPVVLSPSNVTVKDGSQLGVQPSSSDGAKGLLGLGHWLQKKKMRRQKHRGAVGISAGQFMQLQQFKQLAHMMENRRGKAGEYEKSQ